MAAARITPRLLASLTSLAIVAQFFLAGAGAFHAASFDPHRTLGWIVVVLAVLAFAIAVAASRFVRHSAALVVVVALQAGLGVLGSDTNAWFGAVHGINALAVLGVAGSLARRAWER